MDPRHIITAAPVYSPIPTYTFDDDDDDDEAWEERSNPTPPLFMKSGNGDVTTFVIDPLTWLLYVIDEETEEEIIELEMQKDTELWDKTAAWTSNRP